MVPVSAPTSESFVLCLTFLSWVPVVTPLGGCVFSCAIWQNLAMKFNTVLTATRKQLEKSKPRARL